MRDPHCSGYLPSPGGQGYRIWILGVFSIAWLRTGLPALARPRKRIVKKRNRIGNGCYVSTTGLGRKRPPHLVDFPYAIALPWRGRVDSH